MEVTEAEYVLSDDRTVLTVTPAGLKANSIYWLTLAGIKKYTEQPKTAADGSSDISAVNDGSLYEKIGLTVSDTAAAGSTPYASPAPVVIGSKAVTVQEDGSTLAPVNLQIKTDYSPMYCSVESLKVLVDTFNVPDENMRAYIRNASQEADFISDGTADATDFAVQEFTRTRACYDCLLRSYMDRIYNGGGSKYTLDAATYEDSLNGTAFKNLLSDLLKALQKWQDAVRGYYNEGRVKPKATRTGIKSSQNSDVSFTSVDTILQDISRSVPQWS